MTLKASSALSRCLRSEKAEVESCLRGLTRRKGTPSRLRKAMEHSLFSGGKRLRPIILLWTYDAILQDRRRRPAVDRFDAMRIAAALEMIHTYSLIHDDLPAMDDDVLRRGKPTCHVAFDEGTAILAGDALLTDAFSVMMATGSRGLPAAVLIADAAGSRGMVGGQQEDLDSEGAVATNALVSRIHLRKTAGLLGAAFGSGAALAAFAPEKVESVRQAGIDLGLAFQSADDILDVVATSKQLGKTAGKDEKVGKATVVRARGLDAAVRHTRRTGTRGTDALDGLLPRGEKTELLMELCKLLWQRSC